MFLSYLSHIGVASDHTIESFRNDLWPGYKTSDGMLPELLTQIPLMEEALAAVSFPAGYGYSFDGSALLRFCFGCRPTETLLGLFLHGIG